MPLLDILHWLCFAKVPVYREIALDASRNRRVLEIEHFHCETCMSSTSSDCIGQVLQPLERMQCTTTI